MYSKLYTTSQKFLNSKMFNVFFKEFSSAHQANCEIFLLFKITAFYLKIF